MLTGEWKSDVIRELTQFYAPEVLARLTHPDLSRNAFKTASGQLNVCYDQPPTVTVLEADAQPDLSPVVTPRLWPLRQTSHLWTLACNESLIRLDWDEGRRGEVGYGMDYRPVWPDMVVAYANDHHRPDVPVRVEELRLRWPTRDQCEWVWEIWDVSNPDAPVFRCEGIDPDSGERFDVTAKYYDPEKGYPYIDNAGRPILPYVLYHREITNRVWNARDGFEIVEATLKAAVQYTMWLHGLRDCAHPQRIGIDIELPGTRNIGPNGAEVDRLTLDQSSILMAKSKNQPGSGRLETLDPTMDPLPTLEAIATYERGGLQSAGLNGAENTDEGLSRVSGYAIVVSRESVRKNQRRQVPACQNGDALLLATAARMTNRYEATDLPEDPRAYAVSYHGVPKALEEVRADVERIQILRGIGLISDVDALLELHPEWTPDQAKSKLAEIRASMAPAQIEGPAVAPAMFDPSSGDSPSGGRAGAVEIEDAFEVESAKPGDAPPPATAEAPKAQDTALNGAQVTSLLDVIDRVARKQLPRESAVAILVRAFSVASEDAEAMLGTVGQSFFIDEPAPQIAPSSTPPQKPPSPSADEPAPQDAP
jgi:hypothetical protein